MGYRVLDKARVLQDDVTGEVSILTAPGGQLHKLGEGGGKSVQYRTIREGHFTNAGGTSAYWDSVDNAWLYQTRRDAYDSNRSGNYYVLAKKTDNQCIYTAKSVLDGTSYPLKSGSASVTCIRRWNDYYLVTIRSNEPNIPSDGVDNQSIWGYLLVLKASDLSVVAMQSFNAKCSNVNVVSTKYIQGEASCFIVVSCQMSYFQIFKVAVSDSSVTLSARNKTYFSAFKGTSYDDIREDIQEFQVAKTYMSADNTTKLLISAGFGDGVHIVDCSGIARTGKYTEIYSYRWLDHLDVVGQNYRKVGVTAKAGSTFDLVVDYPYVYCTFAQPTGVIQAYNDGLGDCRVQAVLALDISDLTNIVGKLHKIPLEFCQTDTSGDPKPCSIERYKDKRYLGLGDKGIAVFSTDKLDASFLRTVKVGEMNCIRYMALSGDCELLCRNMYNEPICQHSGGGIVADDMQHAQYSTVIDITSL